MIFLLFCLVCIVVVLSLELTWHIGIFWHIIIILSLPLLHSLTLYKYALARLRDYNLIEFKLY